MEHLIDLTVVVPTYQNAPHITAFLSRLLPVLCAYDRRCEIIMVDDGSADETFTLICGWISEHSDDAGIIIRAARLKRNSGQQLATLHGIRLASGRIIVTIDDDLQHRPEDIPGLVKVLEKGYDLAYAVPVNSPRSPVRIIGSRARDILFFLLFGISALGIRPTSFRVFRAEIGERITAQPEGFLYLSAEFFRRTKRITQVPVEYVYRCDHASRYPLSRLIRTFAGLALYGRLFPMKWRVSAAERMSGCAAADLWAGVDELQEGTVRCD